MAINLVKGQKISLVKQDGSSLTSFCVGANWGVITSKGFFGQTKKEAVDLDLSVGLYDADKNIKGAVFYNQLSAEGIRHSGDDRAGDVDGNDDLDNEVIQIDLSAVANDIEHIVFILNSYQQQDFATIPFASIRLYEGDPSRVDRVVATYNIGSDKEFAGYTSMILGKLYRRNGQWKFSAIGEPTQDKELQDSLHTTIQYL
jgi:tellurium resistance protein TerZ